jgi:precorrin-2 C20-methyltransferase/precorrin-3B C17-methyltransferase
MTGTLWGIGLGPGDPELVTVKAARLIGEASVVAYHEARPGRSIARRIAAPYLRAGQIEEALVYPVTTGSTDHPGGYRGALEDFYTECVARLAEHLDTGRDVVVLCEGDPLFYGSYMHLHKRLADRYAAAVVPGVTSVSAASAVLGRPLVERDEILTVLPGTLPADRLASRLAGADPAVVVKLGRTFSTVRDALESAGRLDEAYYVERATMPSQRVAALSDVDPSSVPYFSVAVVPSRLSAHESSGVAEVVVVGLGPGGPLWLTPEASAALASADDLVGYGPYLDRVPVNPRQRRHPSDNREEAARAAYALKMASEGNCVVVVSSGDPGVFAMAAAVLEAAADPQWKDVPVRVVPGVTAAQAVAARVGAPLGHDYCVISLSDRLKPWDVITRRLTAAARADLVIAVYNPASRARSHQLADAKALLLNERDPSTPVVIGRDVGGPEESIRVVRLEDLDPSTVDMRCLLLIGSSQTRLVDRSGSPTVFTPRRYPA